MIFGRESSVDSQKIAAFISANGVTKLPAPWEPGFQETRQETLLGWNPGWSKGIPKGAIHRYRIALGWARANGKDDVSWTDVKEKQLLDLRAQGLTYKQIGKIMGKTKPAIAARVRYLRLGRKL